MQIATILPQNYLHLTKKDTYHMCLAHLLCREGMDAYTEFFMTRPESDYVIMDNGVIEGDPRPIEELIEKAAKVNASEMILPDVFRNKEQTLNAIEDAMRKMPEHHPKLMAVPQGNTMSEWLDCASEIVGNYRQIDTVGIPKVLVDIAGRDGRIFALAELQKRCPIIKHKEIHLLGCWKTPLEILMVDKASRQGFIPKVRGVDSALPYVYTRAHMLMDSDDRPDSNPINFQDGTFSLDGVQEKEYVSLLKKNIKLWRKAADSRSLKEKLLCW